MQTAPVVRAAPRQRRPIDKSLISVTKSAQDGTQSETDLLTVTFPCTIVGLRWNISAIAAAGTAPANCYWAIVVVRDGDSADTMGVSDGATFYNPEQNVLTFGCAALAPNNLASSATVWTGDTKTMRKMKGGDKLKLIVLGESTNTHEFRAIIQFFCKT